MPDYFQLNEEASRSKFAGLLQKLQQQGQGVLNTIEQARLDSLVQFDRRLSAMTSRQQRALRVLPPQTDGIFPVSDFVTIDQTLTTATIRADANAAALRERTQPIQAAVKSTNFSASEGSIETLDKAASIFRVQSSTAPTGQFDIELLEALPVNLVILTMVATPSQPAIQVTASSDGITYVPANNVANNGYTTNAWLPSMIVRYIRVMITPTHPDTLSGTQYTFGITSFTAQAAAFFLRSELVSRVITLTPQTSSWIFQADSDPNITYFLALQGGPFIELQPGATVLVPGASNITAADVGIDTSGVLAHVLDENTYSNTISVTEQGLLGGVVTQVPKVLAPGLSATDPNMQYVVGEYMGVSVELQTLRLLVYNTPIDIGRTFNLSYVAGPATVTAQLKVRLETKDSTKTPVFHGASLQEI